MQWDSLTQNEQEMYRELSKRIDSVKSYVFCQPGLRVDVGHLGRDDEAIHGGGSAPSAVGPTE
jgi:hypothetical protein